MMVTLSWLIILPATFGSNFERITFLPPICITDRARPDGHMKERKDVEIKYHPSSTPSLRPAEYYCCEVVLTQNAPTGFSLNGRRMNNHEWVAPAHGIAFPGALWIKESKEWNFAFDEWKSIMCFIERHSAESPEMICSKSGSKRTSQALYCSRRVLLH